MINFLAARLLSLVRFPRCSSTALVLCSQAVRHFVCVYGRNEFSCSQAAVALQPSASTLTSICIYLVFRCYVFNGRLGGSDMKDGVRAFSAQSFPHLIMQAQNRTMHISYAAAVHVRHREHRGVSVLFLEMLAELLLYAEINVSTQENSTEDRIQRRTPGHP